MPLRRRRTYRRSPPRRRPGHRLAWLRPPQHTRTATAVLGDQRTCRHGWTRRHPAAAARPARHGPRLGPHRPRPRRPQTTIRELVRGDARTVSPQLRDAITDLYDAWWDKRAPERTRAERGAATAARSRAIAGNWCAAAALDDDQLDIPGYRPRHGWKPATGTGIAPDIRPPARHHRRRKGA